MAVASLTLKDLHEQLNSLRERYPSMQEHELFAAWFLRAYLTDSEESAAGAVAGGSRDRSVDAVLIDDAVKAVFIIQSKYRRRMEGKNESRGDIISFAQLATTICDPDEEEFKEFIKNTERYVAELLLRARRAVIKTGYKLRLYYVTLGKCSSALEQEAAQVVRRAKCDVGIEILAGKRIYLLLRDYLDGVAPPIPTLYLEMEVGPDVRVNGVLQRYDTQNEIESWVFSMRGRAVGELYAEAGIRLFARNIRGFIGENTPVNRGMTKTLQSEPDYFFYYNNGITIVCDRAEKVSGRGRDILRVSNPQIINGQQTSRMLSAHQEHGDNASVLIKVIQVPRATGSANDNFDNLISRIVAGTNWQNAIRQSDLMANDRRQIEIERAFRKLEYSYLRKRQTKAEARRDFGGRTRFMIKKEDLALAVAGCNLDPFFARAGKDNLFNEDLYTQVFPSTDPNYYLTRYWLMQDVTFGALGYPQRGYTKWLVLGFMWLQISPLIRSGKSARAFRLQHEHRDQLLLQPLRSIINTAYSAAVRFYNLNKGTGAKAIDISQFFRNRKGRHIEFRHFWVSSDNRYRSKFERMCTKVAKAIEELDR
jgi:hypothetical protein